MKKHLIFKLLIIVLPIFLSGCTEPYALKTNTFESALVVEATITNEYKTQEIKITRTFRFEEAAPAPEADATVYITDSDGNNYDFVEDNGKYVSVNPFEAIPGKNYRLNIETSDGKSYNSAPEMLTTINPIEDVVASVVSKNDERGVQIDVKSYDAANTSKYYRYEYEETYKIISPNWTGLSLLLIPPPTSEPSSTYAVEVVKNEDPNTRICYATKLSTDIILTSTNEQSEDRVNFPLRFISNQNYIISHRYSILVRQYIQNFDSYTFYKTLKEISGSGSLLSQNQPGFFYGNMKSNDNPDEKVIGFFEVSSVSAKRIFFNYVDLFPGEALPPYAVDCGPHNYKFCFDANDPECSGPSLVAALVSDNLLYFSGQNPFYSMVFPECADCTRFASNVIPPFWE